jgi:hypothetical protein
MIHPVLLCNSFNFQLATARKFCDSLSPFGYATFKNRSETTDLANDYEMLMCALFALKFSTSNTVADFEMKTNSDDCGDFDGMVLKVTFMDGQSHTFLFQLKHCENTKKCVTATMLQTREDKFNILKYANCITQFKDSNKGSFILYTNWPTSVENGSVISLGSIGKKEKKLPKYINEEVVVRELREPPNLDPKKLLLIDTQTMGTKFFQFANPINKSVVDLDESLKRFYFFVNQTDTTGAQSLINAMLKEKCGITDSTYSPNFIEFMKRGRLVP